MILTPSHLRVLREALALSEERAAGVPNWDFRAEATFEEWRRYRPELQAAGLIEPDGEGHKTGGGITDAGRVALAEAEKAKRRP